MSDYEGEGWNPVSLANDREIDEQSPHGFTDHVGPRGRVFREDRMGDFKKARRDKRSQAAQINDSFHPKLQSMQPRAHHGTGGRPIEQEIVFHSRTAKLKSFQAWKENPDHPNDVYELDIPWNGLIKAIRDTPETRSSDIAQNSLDRISLMTDAFVSVLHPDSIRVGIWGTESQCQEARRMLLAWEGQIRKTGTRPSHKAWHKEHAYDGRKEDRRRQEEWQDLEYHAIQELDDSHFAFEAYLVWPQAHDLDAYLNTYEPDILKDISRNFRCRFHHERSNQPWYTKIQAETEDTLLAVYQRLINLVKEMMAERHKGLHGNFFRLPSVEAYRETVQVEKDSSASGFTMALTGDGLTENAKEQWPTLMKAFNSRNRKEIMSSIDTFLKSLHLSQSHVRLRVDFGDLFLRRFTRTKDGLMTYHIDDFLNMLQEPRTDLSDPLLLSCRQDLDHLAERLSSAGHFQPRRRTYRQLFDFQGTDSTNRLRLEIEREPGYDEGETQICGQRWLTFQAHGKSTENILGLKMLDFENLSFMLSVNAFALSTNEGIIKDLDVFRSAVDFKISGERLPSLQSSFPKHPKLVAVTEITAVNFQFKDTDGVIELRREDVYKQQDTQQLSKIPSTSKLGLSYYYPDWDNLLGEFSTIRPGEEVTWYRNLTTFFPETADPDRPRSLPKGFRSFLGELYELQVLLKKALTDPE